MDRTLLKEKMSNLKILFIDDEQVVSDIMKEVLPMLFKEAYFANDGLEGFKLYEELNPDVIITDLSMPKLDGISMIRQIKNQDEKVKIICVSGHNELDSISQCEQLGCLYIVKPISSNVLYNTLSKVL